MMQAKRMVTYRANLRHVCLSTVAGHNRLMSVLMVDLGTSDRRRGYDNKHGFEARVIIV